MKTIKGLKGLICSLFLFSHLAIAADTIPATVNINTADAETLATVLNGVGDVRARSIVSWREKNGPFSSAEQLMDVRGVGNEVLAKNRERIVLE